MSSAEYVLYRMRSLYNVSSVEYVLNRMRSLQTGFSRAHLDKEGASCVASRGLHSIGHQHVELELLQCHSLRCHTVERNVLSIECVVYRMCSLYNVFSMFSIQRHSLRCHTS